MNVHVIGAGGHARVVVATLRDAGHRVEGVWDDAPATWGKSCLGAPIRGGLAELQALAPEAAVIAIGDNRTRQRIAGALALPWITAIHPRAWVDASAALGAGTVVFAGAVVQPQATLGAHAIVNTMASVDHDCRIGDFVHLAPGVHLCGNVAVGEGTLIGVGASARPGASIGAWATIGAGACVISPIADHVEAVGVPARPRR